MIWGIVFLISVLISVLILIGILIIPIVITIDSDQRKLDTSISKALNFQIRLHSTYPFYSAEMQFFGYKKEISFKAKKTKSLGKPKNKKKKNKYGAIKFGKIILSILKSFKIHQLTFMIDTGSFRTNAFLYPIFYSKYRGQNIHLNINNNNRNYLFLKISNRPINIILATIKSMF